MSISGGGKNEGFVCCEIMNIGIGWIGFNELEGIADLVNNGLQLIYLFL